MATYTAIPNTDIETDKPIRAVTGRALRDNPTAIAEGAAGAPRVQTAGIQNSAITEDKISNGAVTGQKIQSPTSGTGTLVFRLQESAVTRSSSGFLDTQLNNRADAAAHIGVNCLVSGVITAQLQHRSVSGGTDNSIVRILRNGSVLNSWSTTSTSFQTRQINVSVSVGDSIIFQNNISVGATGSEWRQLRIYSNNPTFAVA